MRLDLHVHSTASDGACDPGEVVALAGRAGLDVIALADHDTVAGVRAALAAGEEQGVRVVPAMEISSTLNDSEYHILGYFIDPEAPALEAHQRRALLGRENRMMEMVDRLSGQGLAIEYEDVLNEAGPERSALARPHLASALVALGHASSKHDAFARLIGDGHPAHVPTRLATPVEAVRIVVESGGIAVWAHPPLDALERVLPELQRAGLRGLEVYRPRSRPEHVQTLERAAREAELLMTGGSDWHSSDGGTELGDFFVTRPQVSAFMDAGGP